MQNERFHNRTERRNCLRHSVSSLTYVRLGEENGGIIVDVGEEGMAVRAAMAVAQDEIPLYLTPLSDATGSIVTTGRIAWRRDAGKLAGIQFVDMPESARSLIRNWIVNESSGTRLEVKSAPDYELNERNAPAEPNELKPMLPREAILRRTAILSASDPTPTHPAESPPSTAAPLTATPRATPFTRSWFLVAVAAALLFIAGLITGVFLNHSFPAIVSSESVERQTSPPVDTKVVQPDSASKQPVQFRNGANPRWIFLGELTSELTWAADSVKTVGNAPWPIKNGEHITIKHDVWVRDGARPSAHILGSLHVGETISIDEVTMLHAKAGGNFVWAKLNSTGKP